MSPRHDLADLIRSRMPDARVYGYPVDPDQVEAGGAIVIQPTTIEVASINRARTSRSYDVLVLVAGEDPEHVEDDLDALTAAFLTATRPGPGVAGLTLGTLTRGTYQDVHPAYSTTITLEHQE